MRSWILAAAALPGGVLVGISIVGNASGSLPAEDLVAGYAHRGVDDVALCEAGSQIEGRVRDEIDPNDVFATPQAAVDDLIREIQLWSSAANPGLANLDNEVRAQYINYFELYFGPTRELTFPVVRRISEKEYSFEKPISAAISDKYGISEGNWLEGFVIVESVGAGWAVAESTICSDLLVDRSALDIDPTRRGEP